MIANRMMLEIDKYKDLLKDLKDKREEIHNREKRLAQEKNSSSYRVAQLEGELAKAHSDRQCEVDRNEHLKKMCNLVEMEKETLAERFSDLQKKLQSELEESSRRISDMENEVSECQHQLRISEKEANRSENEKNDLKSRISDAEYQLSQMVEEKRELEARFSELEQQLEWANEETTRAEEEKKMSLDEMRMHTAQEIRKIQSEYEREQDDLKSKLHTSAVYEKRSKDLEVKASMLELEVRRAKDEWARADRRASELDVSVKKSENERVGNSQLVLQLEGMMNTYKEEVRTLEREKYEVTKKAAELEGNLARMKSDAAKFDEEKAIMKERIWRTERDLEVMRQEKEKLRIQIKKEDRQNDTYLSGWMKNLKPISNVIWGDQRISGPLIKNLADFAILERRGGKKDARVWRCKAKQTSSVYALKTLPNTIPHNAQGSTDLTIFREAMLLKTMDHPNIVSLDGICKDSKGCLSLMLSPFVEIDLDYSVGQRSMNALEIKTLLHQLLLAINYMHKQDIVHRNIKPTNILRFEDYTLKLSGFTYARSIQNQASDMIVPQPPLWFVAPEVLQAQASLKAQSFVDWKAVDIWAIGCVFAEMLLQKPLFAGPQDPLNNILNVLDMKKDSSAKLYPNTTSTMSTILLKSPYASHPSFRPAVALLRDLITFDTSRRITASTALKHEYFAELIQKEPTKSGIDISREAQDSNLPHFVETECSGIL